MARKFTAILTGVSAAALMIGLASTASAQTQQPGFFGYGQGWYWLDSGNDDFRDAPVNNVRPDDGWGGRALLGYQFGSGWDFAVGGQYSDLDRGKKKAGNSSQDADYWAGDLEFGKTMMLDMFSIRPFIGARYAEFDHKAKGFGQTQKNDWYGYGPRLGFDTSVRLGDSGFSIFGGAAGSYLFGKMKENSSFFGKDKKSADVWQIDGQIGVGYEVTQNFTIGAGYRADYWDGVADRTALNDDGNSSGDRFMHGPFVRASYNFGAPRRVMARPVATPPAPPPAAAPRQNYIVFFDFDRSNITADAQRVIGEAATAAKAGNRTRIELTGHTDRSGSDQYNMALSMRRGEAVKQALIAQGIPASAISIIARGESQPLVPTADGVREAQNRRVEIVLM
jgi:outer membrane protein OmpA-like peptidoglycan-associated protein